MRSIRTSYALVLAGVVMTVALPAGAHPTDIHTSDGVVDSAVEAAHQHGANDGHLPAGSENVSVIGKLDVNPPEGGIADIAVMGNHAYLNAWEPYCPKAGVIVADISDPTNPRRIDFRPANTHSYPGEGAQVVNVTTKYFNGDLLFTNNDPCDSARPFDGGANLWTVTDPTHPIVVARGVGDWNRMDPRVEQPGTSANSSHSVFAWDAGAKAYTVLVDNVERSDVDIIDITQ